MATRVRDLLECGVAHTVKRDPGNRQRHGAVHHRKVFSRRPPMLSGGRLFPNSVATLALNLLLMASGTFFVPCFGLPMPKARNSQNRTSPVQAASKDQTNEQVFYHVPKPRTLDLGPLEVKEYAVSTDAGSIYASAQPFNI